MNDIRTRVAYLHGLAEGLDIDQTSSEGRLIASMLDVLGDLADQIMDVADGQAELAQYIEDVDYDLGALEEQIYVEDEDEVVRFTPDSHVLLLESADEDDGVDVELVACPSCGEALAAGAGETEQNLDVVCPNCGCMVCETDEYDEDFMVEHD